METLIDFIPKDNKENGARAHALGMECIGEDETDYEFEGTYQQWSEYKLLTMNNDIKDPRREDVDQIAKEKRQERINRIYDYEN